MADIEQMERLTRKLLDHSFYESIVNDVPQPKAGIVHCHECGNSIRVNAAYCLRSGWPKCHGQTMSLDPAKEK